MKDVLHGMWSIKLYITLSYICRTDTTNPSFLRKLGNLLHPKTSVYADAGMKQCR